ncbi:MAG: glycosyltransferase [Calditrichae bacterium]|nr:glycosyltransferase [Calditrichia bacterium]
MRQPKVSVIILTYNREELLRETVATVLSQSFGDFRLIIVDDGSADNTQTMLQKFNDSRIDYHFVTHTGHISRLRNYGLNQSKGELIAFLDSDDLWDANHLQAQVNLLDNNPQAGFVFNDAMVFDAERVLLESIYEGLENSQLNGNILTGVLAGNILLMPASTLMFRKTCLEKTGFLNERFKAGEYEFLTRLLYHYRGLYCDSPMVRIRRHGGNNSAKLEIDNYDEAIYCVEKYYSSGDVTDDLHRKLLLQYHYKLGVACWKQNRHLQALKEFLLCYKIKPVLAGTLMRNLHSLMRGI